MILDAAQVILNSIRAINYNIHESRNGASFHFMRQEPGGIQSVIFPKQVL